MDFAKYHALGNDYVVVDPNQIALQPTPQRIRLLCDRHFGIGADGVLLGPTAPVRAGHPVELRIFNSDGGECERSGNGLRIFALYLAQHYGPDGQGNPAGPGFVIRTVAGDTEVRLLAGAPGRGVADISVEMGRPRLDALAQPLTVCGEPLLVTRVHNGNPHAVVPTGEVSEQLARRLGPHLVTSPEFPERTNVQFLRVIDRATVQIEIWERGAGYTLASGSSSCAAASAAHALGLVDRRVEVRMPGGSIHIELAGDGAVTMIGPAEEVISGWFAPALLARLGGRPGVESGPGVESRPGAGNQPTGEYGTASPGELIDASGVTR